LEFEISLRVAGREAIKSSSGVLKPQAQRTKPPLGGAAAKIVLPFADFPRGALHLGFENFVGDPAQEIQRGGHWRDPCRCSPVNHEINLQPAGMARRDADHKISFSI